MSGGSRFFSVVTTVVIALVTTGIAGAQDYELLGSLETRSVSAYRKDSPVVLNPEERGAWYTTALTRLEATHRLTLPEGTAELLVDHAVTVLPLWAAEGVGLGSVGLSPASLLSGVGNGAESTGTAGTGSATANSVFLWHELYQAYLSVSASPALTLRLGRQRLNWGMGWTFSVTDALHPQSPDSEVEPGFDGVSLGIVPSSALSLELAAATQDALATGDPEDLRFAAYGSVWAPPVDVALTWVYQYATTLRPGVGVSLPLGPVLVGGEAAVEVYDPRKEEINYQGLASIGGEYSWYPDAANAEVSVTSDAAGGFLRPGRHYLSGGASLTVSDSWSTAHSVLANLSDESSVVRHELSLLRIPAVDLTAALTWTAGIAGSEFGLVEEGMIVELGATAYF